MQKFVGKTNCIVRNLKVADFPFQNAFPRMFRASLLQVIRCAVSIKHGLRTGYKIRTRYKTRTGKYGLGIKHGLGIKRGLQAADWV